MNPIDLNESRLSKLMAERARKVFAEKLCTHFGFERSMSAFTPEVWQDTQCHHPPEGNYICDYVQYGVCPYGFDEGAKETVNLFEGLIKQFQRRNPVPTDAIKHVGYRTEGVETGRRSYADPPRSNDLPVGYSPNLTGRLHANEPEVQFIPFGRRNTADKDLHTTILNFDYTDLETRVAEAMDENEKLRQWANGQNPMLKVRIAEEYGVMVARHGRFGLRTIGTDTRLLTEIGYKFEIEYRRDYYDAGTDEIKRLRPQQVPYEIAASALYAYQGHIETDDQDTEPYAEGGDTTVRVYAPSGHWAEGVSLCAPDDPFNKKVGRTMALMRAFEKLNGLVND